MKVKATSLEVERWCFGMVAFRLYMFQAVRGVGLWLGLRETDGRYEFEVFFKVLQGWMKVKGRENLTGFFRKVSWW